LGGLRLVFTSAAVLAATMLGGCTRKVESNLSSQPEINISQAALSAYNNRYLGRHLPLAFAVSPDGEAFAYYYCDVARCIGGIQPSQEAISRALNDCNNEGHGQCVLFAVGTSAPRKYRLID